MQSGENGEMAGLRAARRKTMVGDTFEVWTRDGLGYVQYSHRDPENGQLLRVLPGLFAHRISDSELGRLVGGPESYFVFSDVDDDVVEGWLAHVGSFQVPSGSQGMPPLRFEHFETDRMRSVLWNGRQVFVDEFTSEQQRWSFLTHLPIHELRRRMATGWTLEDYQPMRSYSSRELVMVEQHYLVTESESEAERLLGLVSDLVDQADIGREGKWWVVTCRLWFREGSMIRERSRRIQELAVEPASHYDGMIWGWSAPDEIPPGVQPPTTDSTFEENHYLLTPSPERAHRVAAEMSALSSTVEVVEVREFWMVVAHVRVTDVRGARSRAKEIRGIAKKHGVDYDGYEHGTP